MISIQISTFSKHNKGKCYGLWLLFEEELKKHAEIVSVFEKLAKGKEYEGEMQGSKL